MSGSTRIRARNRPGARAEWLFADIGGTNARFARWRKGEGIDAKHRRAADDFADLGDAVEAFERGQAGRASHAALAIAVRVRGPRMTMTNRGWTIDAQALRDRFDFDELHLVNDFVAAAAGLSALDEESSKTVRAGSPGSSHRLLIGPGTGLGAAALLDAGSAVERVLASEAGHMGFAWHSPALEPLLAAAHARWPRLSWERLLSGEGLGVLHAWQARQPHGSGSADSAAATGAQLPAPEISARAAAGDAAACRAVQWFSRLLGAFAGDLCLAFGAEGGVWLTGGVLDGIGAGFDEAAFLEAFDDKGRYAARQREVPVHRVRGGDLAFRGLERIVNGACRAPGLRVTRRGIEDRP